MGKAQNRVKELNENLADWYYVISNEVYEKSAWIGSIREG